MTPSFPAQEGFSHRFTNPPDFLRVVIRGEAVEGAAFKVCLGLRAAARDAVMDEAVNKELKLLRFPNHSVPHGLRESLNETSPRRIAMHAPSGSPFQTWN